MSAVAIVREVVEIYCVHINFCSLYIYLHKTSQPHVYLS